MKSITCLFPANRLLVHALLILLFVVPGSAFGADRDLRVCPTEEYSFPTKKDAPEKSIAATVLSTINPYFGFSGLTTGPDFVCLQDGAYLWDNNRWFVQTIHGLLIDPEKCSDGNPCTLSLVRVCSKSAVHKDPNDFHRGPCGTTAGAGPRGCEVCLSKEIAL